jgi:CheY-like chemotaxis protein
MTNPSAEAERRVLIVDDDADFSLLLVEILESIGIIAKSAKNGRVALEQLRTGFRPDAIVLDLMMPEMDGWEFRRRQRLMPELASIPIVVLSADGHLADQAAGIEADGFILKPPTLDALVKEIERVLDRRPRAA